MISKFSVKKPVTIVMITLIVMIFGGISLTNLTTDLFPSMNIPIAAVSTVYFGASPEEVESLVTEPMEGQLATVNNVSNITSISSEHSSLIIVEFANGTDMNTAMMDLRDTIDLIMGFMPETVSDPMIIKFDPSMMPIMSYSITQEGKSMAETTFFIENVVAPRIESLDGVATVTVSGGVEEKILVNIDSDKLAVLGQMGITKNAISEMLQGQNLILPAGTITENNKDYSIRASGKLEDVEDVENLVLLEMDFPVIQNPMTGADMDFWEVMEAMEAYPEMFQGIDLMGGMSDDTGAAEGMGEAEDVPAMPTEFMQIRLSDIADIQFQETDAMDYSKVNGEDAISISVQKQTDVGTSTVTHAIAAEMADIEAEYPGMTSLVLLDQGEYIDMVTQSVGMNALIGGLLAVLILFIFLKDLRPTVVIGVSIPVSIVGAFTALWLADITLNIVSMGGLALGIGMLVDNSVVVLENIYRMRKEGLSRREAAIAGAKQVSGAIIASTLTTIAVFMPVMFVQGFTAEIFQEMAIVVSITLIASLVVALTLVPMMSSKLIKKPDTSTHHKFMDRFRSFYTVALKWSLRYRILIIVLTVVVFGGSIFGITQLGMELMPASDEGQIDISVQMPRGTTFNETTEAVSQVEAILEKYEDIETVSASVSGGAGMMAAFMGGGSDTGSITILLKNDADRSYSTAENADMIRAEVQGLTAAENISVDAVTSSMMMGGGMMGGGNVQVSISGSDFEVLEDLAIQVAGMVESIEGTTEVDNGIEVGAPELNIDLRDNALASGAMTPFVSSALNELITGVESTSIKMDGREVAIYINETNNGQLTLSDVPNVEVETMMGGSVTLSDVADISEGEGYTSITRENQRRVLSVSAKLLEGYDSGTIGMEIQDLVDDLNVPEGYMVTVGGEFDDIMDSFQSLALSLLLGVVLIYMIMASQFESFKYPFIILFTIPLAFTGSLLGLIITGTSLNIVSVLGFLVLSGVVVNNGIVLVDYINKLKESGMGTKEAILTAGPIRLRPILMTALTTILALLPSAIGFGEGAEMMQPLGISVIGGLIMSTFLTLIVVPSIYYMLDKKGRLADQAAEKTEA